MRGIYLLLIFLKKDTHIRIGKLGDINFEKGRYIYVGSAQNSLETRIKRHLSENKKLFWHIDYLLNNKNASIEKVYYKLTNKKSDECKYAKLISKKNSVINKFGSSDSKCKSHLIHVKNIESIKPIMADKFYIYKK